MQLNRAGPQLWVELGLSHPEQKKLCSIFNGLPRRPALVYGSSDVSGHGPLLPHCVAPRWMYDSIFISEKWSSVGK